MTNGLMIDSSSFINYFNKTLTPKNKIVNLFLDADAIISLPVIMQEVLQGIKNQKFYLEVLETFLGFNFPQYDPLVMAIESANLFRFLAKKGITIRKPNDCLIASICLKLNTDLLHDDKDFTQIAKHTKLKIYNTNS